MNSRFSFSVFWVLIAALAATSLAALPRKHTPVTSLTVVVIDAISHKPVFQARLTLQFRDPQSHIGRTTAYNAKTDSRGRYKFLFIPMEAVFLTVTDPNHQSFGRQFEVTESDQVIHVSLNPPQPLR
ncbi:MAG: hypothetical protein ACRD3D_03040 [Terriglobia bacterium]